MADGAARIWLKDYAPPSFALDRVFFCFEFAPTRTRVTCRQTFIRGKIGAADAPLALSGRDFELISLRLNGRSLDGDEIGRHPNGIVLKDVPDQFTLEIVSAVSPQANSAALGLFMDGESILSHMEADGMSRLTYFLDRPDVLSRYEVRLEADRRHFPILLSNGERVETGDLENGRHYAVWRDDIPKPCYIFAVAAGAWDKVETNFRTIEGRNVAIAVYAATRHRGRCTYLLDALRRVMRWEEIAYARAYDLNALNVVVPDHHAISQENKGLILLEAAYAIADPSTSTDDDFDLVERIAAHEYLHNWTGNRVTCRDWFQLSLKEGLTRFRDQEFSASVSAPDVKRITTVRNLRTNQFAEDLGPAAHPVQPASYIAVANLYTTTVYDKGAEIVRMASILLGPKNFRKGMELYFDRHDGSAATIEDFLAALGDASGKDLSQFRLWYHRAGLPVLELDACYDPMAGELALRVRQASLGADEAPLHIPFRVGLIGSDGRAISPTLESAANADGLIEIRQREEIVVFRGLKERPVVSCNRGFSAPVRVVIDRTTSDLAQLYAFDHDGYARWDAGQDLMGVAVREMSLGQLERSHAELLTQAMGRVLLESDLDNSLRAELLTFPHIGLISEALHEIDIDGLASASACLRKTFAEAYRDALRATFEACAPSGSFSLSPEAKGARRLRAICLDYLLELEESDLRAIAREEACRGASMTARSAALYSICNHACSERDEALEQFLSSARGEEAAMRIWFRAQAVSRLPGTASTVRRLSQSRHFDLANVPLAMALLGGFFRQNRIGFHEIDGSGYRFLAETLLTLDKLRPQSTRWLTPQIVNWRRFDLRRQNLMRSELERVARTEGISKELSETLGRALGEAHVERPIL